MDYLELTLKGKNKIDLETLTDRQYIEVMSMLGKLFASDIIIYMRGNNLDELIFENGIVIKQDKIGNYMAVFKNDDGETDSISLDLFLLLNRSKYGDMFVKREEEHEHGRKSVFSQ